MISNPTEREQKVEGCTKAEFQCNDCDVAFKTKKKLKKHRNRVHRIRCMVCQKLFESTHALKQHADKYHAGKESLDETDATNLKQVTLPEKDNVHVHKETEYVPYSLQFKCEICRIFFATSKSLEEHFDTVHLDEIKCGYCKIEFQAIADMDQHMDMKHKGMWKLNDPDILRDGDSEFEEEFEDH